MRSVNLEKTLLSDGLSAKAVAFLTQMHVVSVRANPSESLADHRAVGSVRTLGSVALQPQSADANGCSRVLKALGRW